MSAPPRPKAFDPFSSSVQEAAALQDEERTGWKGSISQWIGAQDLQRNRKRYETVAVLEGIAQCVRRGLRPPDWLEKAFAERFAAACDVNSFDDAFGTPYPARTHVATLRKREAMRWMLHAFFLEHGAPSRTPHGFALAAKHLGITPKQAKEWTPKTRSNEKARQPHRRGDDGSPRRSIVAAVKAAPIGALGPSSVFDLAGRLKSRRVARK